MSIEDTSPQELLDQARQKMDKALSSTAQDMASIRTGQANPTLLDRVVVDYYGTPTPVNQMANVSIQGGQTLVIQPYDKSSLSEIEKAISKSELNLPPQNDGTVIRLNIPPLTEESRKEQVKVVKRMGEDGKVAVRNIRRDCGNDIEKHSKAVNLSEDEQKDWQGKVDDLTQEYNQKLDNLVSQKEKDLLNF